MLDRFWANMEANAQRDNAEQLKLHIQSRPNEVKLISDIPRENVKSFLQINLIRLGGDDPRDRFSR